MKLKNFQEKETQYRYLKEEKWADWDTNGDRVTEEKTHWTGNQKWAGRRRDGLTN